MSIKTTHEVERNFAIAAIASKLHEMDNEQLADVLETTIHNGFYNFIVVDKFDDHDEYPAPRLDRFPLPESNDAY